MIKRDKYLDLLIKNKDTDYVKLLIGVRRSGKTILLLSMENYLINNGVDKENIININFEKIKNDYLKEGKELHNFIESKITNTNKYYLFLDEVQEIEECARVVNSLRVSYNIDIYSTGSNARMFVGEHLT